MTRAFVNVDDLRRSARRRLPRAVFDFIDGAAEDETTLRRNREAFDRWSFVPRSLVDVAAVDLGATVLGREMRTPMILAPTGLCGMAAPRPEILAARAAGKAGLVFTASCLSSVTIEEIARAATGPLWFQLYVWKDRELTMSVVKRAAEAGCEVMMVTVDVPVFGRRERDARNGATIPPRVTLRNAFDLARTPRWTLGMLRNPPFQFANAAGSAASTSGPFGLMHYVNSQFDPSVSWDDVARFREAWRGPLLLKGVMSAEDAAAAAEHGVDGIVVSNHGGRQLDGLPGSLEVLPEIVNAVSGRLEVLFDGGIRRGTDVAKALALGARACLVGRPYLYGLGAAGEVGAGLAIEFLEAELRRALALLGRPTVSSLDRSCLRPA